MLTLAELLALSTDGMSVDELNAHAAAILAAMQEAAPDARTDEQLAELGSAADAVEAIGVIVAEATAADEAAQAAAQAAVDRAAAVVASADGEGDEGDEGTGDESTDETETGDGDESTEGEGDDESTDATDSTGTGDESTDETETPEALAAAGGRPAPHISNVNARRPAAAQPRPRRATPSSDKLTLFASANAPGIGAGAPVDTYEKLATVFESAIKVGRNYHGPAVNVPLVFASNDMPDEFSFVDDPKVNAKRIEKLRDGIRREGGLTKLAAAGGACAPYDVSYDQPFVGSDARPVRDNLLNRMGVPRGGVTMLPTVRFDELNGAVAFWDDTAGHVVGQSGQTTKPIIEVECDDPYDVDTYEVTERVRFGTIKARYFPERVKAILEALGVAHARKADTKLLQLLGSSSTPDGGAQQLTAGQRLGTTRNTLTVLDRYLAGYRSSYRLDRKTPVVFAHPEWFIDQMRADLVREAPGSADERLATADTKIAELFTMRGVIPKSFMDGESGQVFTFQGDGPVQGWPSTCVTYLYPDGDAHFLDGGTIEYGIVRDSGLIEINKHEIFSESTEGFMYHSSVERARLVLDTCPDGTTAGPVDTTGYCATGS